MRILTWRLAALIQHDPIYALVTTSILFGSHASCKFISLNIAVYLAVSICQFFFAYNDLFLYIFIYYLLVLGFCLCFSKNRCLHSYARSLASELICLSYELFVTLMTQTGEKFVERRMKGELSLLEFSEINQEGQDLIGRLDFFCAICIVNLALVEWMGGVDLCPKVFLSFVLRFSLLDLYLYFKCRCAMALVHQRIRRIFYALPNKMRVHWEVFTGYKEREAWITTMLFSGFCYLKNYSPMKLKTPSTFKNDQIRV